MSPIPWFWALKLRMVVIVHVIEYVIQAESSLRPLEVELVSLGTMSPLSTTSFTFLGPSMETTLNELKAGPYASYMNLSWTFFKNPNVSDGTDVPTYTDQQMANWYYMNRSRTANVSIIILPGKEYSVCIFIIMQMLFSDISYEDLRREIDLKIKSEK